MNVLQFSIIGTTSGSAFTYTGNTPMNGSNSLPLTPTAISLAGQIAYNSKLATNASSPWTNVVISVQAGPVGLELFQA